MRDVKTLWALGTRATTLLVLSGLLSYASGAAGALLCDVRLGDGVDELRSVGGVGDSARFRDYTVILDAHTIVVLDPLAQRLIRRKVTNGRCEPSRELPPLALPSTNFLVSIAQTGHRLYGLTYTGKVVIVGDFLGPNNAAFRSFDGSAESGGSVPQPVIQRFSEMLRPLPGRAGTYDPATHRDGAAPNEAGLTSDLTRNYPSGMASAADGSVVRYRLRLCSQGEGVIETWSEADPKVVFNTPLRARGTEWLGGINLARVKDSSHFDVLFQTFSVTKQGQFTSGLNLLANAGDNRAHIRRLQTRDLAAISPPVAADVIDSSAESSIAVWYLISVTGPKQKVEYLRVAAVATAEIDANDRPVSAGCLSGATRWAPGQAVDSSLNPTQKAIVGRAADFIQARWCVKPENIRQPGDCIAPYDRPDTGWKQPFSAARLAVGSKASGVFYLWGGKGSLAEILNRYGVGCEWPAGTSSAAKQSAVAGNVCTKISNGVPAHNPAAAGIDCSGFVSRAWALKQSPGTADLQRDPRRFGVSEVLALPQLKVGDAFMYRTSASGHIRLFGGWVATPLGLKARIYESTTENVCSGTCLRDLDPLQLSGYRMLGLAALHKTQTGVARTDRESRTSAVHQHVIHQSQNLRGIGKCDQLYCLFLPRCCSARAQRPLVARSRS